MAKNLFFYTLHNKPIFALKSPIFQFHSLPAASNAADRIATLQNGFISNQNIPNIPRRRHSSPNNSIVYHRELLQMSLYGHF